MTPEQIELLEASLHHLKRDSVFAAQLFYCRLFSRCPRLRRVFGGTPDFDGRRLFWALNAVSAALADPQRFVGLLTILARPMVRDALRYADCIDAVNDAMQWMLLKHGLGHPQPVREAWQAAHRELSDVIGNGGTLEAAPVLQMHPPD
jgi:hemoglobin-like flavoprotein